MDRMVVCNAVAILAIRRPSTYQRLLSVTPIHESTNLRLYQNPKWEESTSLYQVFSWFAYFSGKN